MSTTRLVRDDNHLLRAGEDHRRVRQGLGEYTLCTPEYLRDVLHGVAEERKTGKADPILSPLDTDTNTLYEGCNVVAWGLADGEEMLLVRQRELGRREFKVASIREVYITY